MSTYIDVARRIAKIIISPDSVSGFFHGVMSIPQDLGYLAYGFLDTDSRYIRGNERIRMAKALQHGILQNSNFIKTVENVLDVFNKYIPQEIQNSLYSKTLFSVTGRAVGNTVVSGRIAQVIAQRASFTVGVRGSALGNVLLSGGMIERSIYTSFRLQTYAPEVYNSLRRYDYDLLYFFLEPALQPFLEAIHIRHTFGQSAFNKIIDELDNELQKKRI